jgi:uncharacterized protein YciI
MRGQDGWDAHAAFVDALTAEGFIVAGGPLGGEDDARRVLHIVRTNDVGEIERRLAEDPWTSNGLLRTLGIEPWTVLLGGFGAAFCAREQPAARCKRVGADYADEV